MNVRKEHARTVIYVIVGLLMAVTVGHVAEFTGSLEPGGNRWLGWPYAIAVDLAIAACAWLTTWATTSTWAWVGYVLFVGASGAMNVAHVRPWERGADAIGAWIYAVFPTVAQALLGFLARDAGKFHRRRSESAEMADLRASLKTISAKAADYAQQVARLEAELDGPRDLLGTTRAAFDAFRATVNGQGAGLTAAQWNVELARAGMAPISESTLRAWIKEARDGAKEEQAK